MGRVINTNNPGKRRNHFMRTIAELLRRLSQKPKVDNEVKDMVAMIVFCLRGIEDTIEESVQAWEKRGYWKKADDFHQKWWWASRMSADVKKLAVEEQWDQMPEMMVKLFPYFSDIQINKMTRNESMWDGCYEQLMEEKQKPLS